MIRFDDIYDIFLCYYLLFVSYYYFDISLFIFITRFHSMSTFAGIKLIIKDAPLWHITASLREGGGKDPKLTKKRGKHEKKWLKITNIDKKNM